MVSSLGVVSGGLRGCRAQGWISGRCREQSSPHGARPTSLSFDASYAGEGGIATGRLTVHGTPSGADHLGRADSLMWHPAEDHRGSEVRGPRPTRGTSRTSTPIGPSI